MCKEIACTDYARHGKGRFPQTAWPVPAIAIQEGGASALR